MSSIIPNIGGHRGEYVYTHRGVPISLIELGARKRPTDPEAVQKLKASILAHGQLLAPVGVRASRGDDGGPYTLVYGAHRMQAIHELFEEGKWGSHSLPCIIFTSGTPDWFCEMAEIAENLIRKDLVDKQKDRQTARYAALIAQNQNIKVGRKRGGVEGNRSKGKVPDRHAADQDATPTASDGDTGEAGQTEPDGQDEEKKPDLTVVDIVSKEIGVTPQTVMRRIRKVAKAAGMGEINFDTLTADDLMRMLDEADKNDEKAAAEASERRKETANARTKAKAENEDIIQLAEDAIETILSKYDIEVFKEATRRVWKRRYPNGRVPFCHDAR